jgi:exodeoxyribonuclease VII large subunit
MNQLPLFQPASLSVSEITRYLRSLLENDEVLQDVWVQGEISNFSRPSSGHLYFTLKDSAAALRCVVWKSVALRMRLALQNGLSVEAHGAIGIYERDGQYQLYVDTIRPAGEGLLFQEFIRLKNRLEAEGLFDLERKRPIPERPHCIGIVTSPTGAALQDMLNTLRARYPLGEVLISPCAVQGDRAPEEIVGALQRLSRTKAEAILVARGGGSLEDLWAFNDERVVRAIASSPIPVVTRIGHETDFTLADFASDVRAPTPTGAAVRVTPDRADLAAELGGAQNRLGSAISSLVSQKWQDLEGARQRLDRASPARRIRSERQALDEWQERHSRALSSALRLHRAHLQGMVNRLQTLNPASVLKRGYATVEREDGSLVRSVTQASVGEGLGIHLWDGKITTRVEGIQPVQFQNQEE